MNSIRRVHKSYAMSGLVSGRAPLLAAVLAGALALGSAGASAQQPVFTIPNVATTAGGNASTTITVTDTFQLVFAAQAVQPGAQGRKGCTIVNYGTHTMWVTEGIATASATKAKAVQLAAGQSYFCAVGGIALQGLIAITGTAADAFYAAQY